MPRVLVTDENGAPTWVERVMPEDFATEHFRRCPCERLRWAVADAEAATPTVRAVATPEQQRRRSPEPTRIRGGSRRITREPDST